MGIRNQNTRHEAKSRRRERALDRLPALLPLPVPPATPKPVKLTGKQRRGKEKEVIVPTVHEQDLLAVEQGNFQHHMARAQRHNDRVTRERAALEARIGKPPRQWPKRERPVHAPAELGAPYGADDVFREVGQFMNEVNL